jgi:hypothetical protein
MSIENTAAHRAKKALLEFYSKLWAANAPAEGCSPEVHRASHWRGDENTPGIPQLQAEIIRGALPAVLAEAAICGMQGIGDRVQRAADTWARKSYDLIYPSGGEPWTTAVSQTQLAELLSALAPIITDLDTLEQGAKTRQRAREVVRQLRRVRDGVVELKTGTGLDAEELQKRLEISQIQVMELYLAAACDGLFPAWVEPAAPGIRGRALLLEWDRLAGALEVKCPGRIPARDTIADGHVELIGENRKLYLTRNVGRWINHAVAFIDLLLDSSTFAGEAAESATSAGINAGGRIGHDETVGQWTQKPLSLTRIAQLAKIGRRSVLKYFKETGIKPKGRQCFKVRLDTIDQATAARLRDASK